jgi:dUTP pyrophosphatase
LSFEIPFGYEMQVRARSGLAAKNGIGLVNGTGTIDPNYRGELGIILINHGKEPFVVNKGDRIAQVVFNKIEHTEIEEVDELSETNRGECGFGSSGIK